MRIAKPGRARRVSSAPVSARPAAPSPTAAEAAGKGALIGGLAGAALGGGYGAYKTKQECGTIFGDTFNGLTRARPAGTTPAYR